MADKQIFQFTLGPVQGFVAQARRTRDFWAGSFILSWLASVAMESIAVNGGEVQFPKPDEDYLKALRGELGPNANVPLQGSVPNRFSAVMAAVPADFEPQKVSDAVQLAWHKLAEVVWERDLAGCASQATRAIWERQVRHFWEMSWVMSDGENPQLLDQRKNWRNLIAPEEPGHKCMMMDGWQELSGVLETNMAQVNKFWDKVRGNGQTGMKTDLREGEHLCAMAFIKRRFSRYFADVKFGLNGSKGERELGGWGLPSAVPSVAFVAAAPWIAELVQHGSADAWQDFADAASQVTGASEAAHVGAGNKANQVGEIEILCVANAAKARQQGQQDFQKHWAGMDGQVYYPTLLDNVRLFDAEPAQLNRVRQTLQQLKRSAGLRSSPSPYYAVLLMDGDQLGKHMSNTDKRNGISAALNAFTGKVGEVVRKHNGFLIYAGGDDVLALLPLASAMSAAAHLQALYKCCFAKHCPPGKGEVKSTLSGAIEYVHVRTPLTQVLKDAHKLLDDVAKEQVGRNAVAVRVWKPSGVALTWAMPWEKALVDEGKGPPILNQLAEAFAQDQGSADDRAFSVSFFHRMQDVVGRFADADAETLEKLVTAEYRHSWGSKASAVQEAKLAPLLSQCLNWERAEAGKDAQRSSKQPMNPSAAQLVRFLALQGQEKQWQ